MSQLRLARLVHPSHRSGASVAILKESDRSFRSEGPKGWKRKKRCSSRLSDPARSGPPDGGRPVSTQILFPNRPAKRFK